MKFLLDENISRRIIPLPEDSLGEVIYLISPKTDLVQPVSDHLVWKYAKENGYNIITRDEDFIKLSLLLGCTSKSGLSQYWKSKQLEPFRNSEE
jgi:predicted nuclease of predicted toxin-antitoxin system